MPTKKRNSFISIFSAKIIIKIYSITIIIYILNAYDIKYTCKILNISLATLAAARLGESRAEEEEGRKRRKSFSCRQKSFRCWEKNDVVTLSTLMFIYPVILCYRELYGVF